MQQASQLPTGSGGQVAIVRGRNSSGGHATSHAEEFETLYDIDGKVPFSYYEKGAVFYDVDGKHRYK